MDEDLDADLTDVDRINAILGQGRDFNENEDREQSDGQSVMSSYQQYLTPGATTPFSSRSSSYGLDVSQGPSRAWEPLTYKPVEENPSDSGAVFGSIPPCIENCLALNQAYQTVLEDTIEHLTGLLVANQEKQSSLQLEIDEHSKQKSGGNRSEKPRTRHLPLALFGIPYFKDDEFNPCPPNNDTVLVNELRVSNLYLKLQKVYPWDKKKEGKLLDAIRKEVVEQETRRLFTRREDLRKELERAEEDQRESLSKQIKDLTLKLYDVEKNVNFEEEIAKDQEYNWARIATTTFGGKLSENEVRLYWKNYLHPGINKTTWTNTEIKKLKMLVGKDPDWDEIAKNLGTGRTSIQCFAYYQYRINEAHSKRSWTKQDTAKLKKEFLRTGKFIWEDLAPLFPGKSKDYVNTHWLRVANYPSQTTPFTKADDYILIECVKNGLEFKEIATLLSDKQEIYIRRRYYNLVLQGEAGSLAKFTPEEDAKIQELCIEKNFKAFQLRSFFPGRTEAQIATRHRLLKLKDQEPEKFDKITKVHNRLQGGVFHYGRLRQKIASVVDSLAKTVETNADPEYKTTLTKARVVLNRIKQRRKPVRNKHKLKNVESALKEYIAPYFYVYRGRMRKTVFPGDIREHALNYCALSRVLYVKLPVRSDDIEENHTGLKTYVDLFQHAPQPDTTSEPVCCIPPNLCTVAGFRGLLLHRSYLNSVAQNAERRETHRRSQPAESGADQPVPSIAESAVNNVEGDPEADHLLMTRILGMFFWPAVLSITDVPEGLHAQAPPEAAAEQESGPVGGEEENHPQPKRKLSRAQFNKLKAERARTALLRKYAERKNQEPGTCVAASEAAKQKEVAADVPKATRVRKRKEVPPTERQTRSKRSSSN